MKHSLKDWFAVTRYWSFPVSVMPVVVTTAYLAWTFEASLINWLNAVLALVGIVFFHAGGNVISDWADYRSGVDNENAFAVPNLVFHKFKPLEYLKFGTVLLAIGVALGLVLVLRTGWTLLLVGLLGAL
ncbi:MAG: prenyltransferase, partial [Bacteroidales bacterium]|nr:prenyltransferase [Bacteroidales bacterium]